MILEKRERSARKNPELPAASGHPEDRDGNSYRNREASREICHGLLLAEAAGGIKPGSQTLTFAFVPFALILAGSWQFGRTAMPATAKMLGSMPEFPVGTDRLEKLRSLGFSADELYRIVAPRRTLARRRENGKMLSAGESDRVLRLERVAEHAERVFGSHEKAHRWLRSEIIALDGARPIDLLEGETGAHIVEQELIKIDYGMLA